MRFIAALVAIGALSQTAVAQTPECRTIADAKARLGCYDTVNSGRVSSAVGRPAVAPPPVRRTEADTYVDSIGAEDARVNAQLKNICRGC
jgi:hypothetical protein